MQCVNKTIISRTRQAKRSYSRPKKEYKRLSVCGNYCLDVSAAFLVMKREITYDNEKRVLHNQHQFLHTTFEPILHRVTCTAAL